jgi:hypothetical protein
MVMFHRLIMLLVTWYCFLKHNNCGYRLHVINCFIWTSLK